MKLFYHRELQEVGQKKEVVSSNPFQIVVPKNTSNNLIQKKVPKKVNTNKRRKYLSDNTLSDNTLSRKITKPSVLDNNNI